MLIVLRLARRLTHHLTQVSWPTMLLALIAYVTVSFAALYLADEPVAQGSLILFWYFLVVTSSTVGFGDYSATTPAGMLVISLWVIPAGLSLWGTLIGRIANGIMQHLQRGLKGMRTLNHSNHTLVIGYNGSRTQQLLELLLREAHSDELANIVLCAHEDKIEENPLPDRIGFVRVSSFNNGAEMARANVARARTILIDTPVDDVTLTTAMFCHGANPEAHILAYFHDEATSRLLKRHCPGIECIPSVSVEMLAKAAADPGSSALHHELLNVEKGQTQYSVLVPDQVKPFKVRDVYLLFKERYDATVISIYSEQQRGMTTNPALDVVINPADRIYYIADERILAFDWSGF